MTNHPSVSVLAITECTERVSPSGVRTGSASGSYPIRGSLGAGSAPREITAVGKISAMCWKVHFS